MPNRSAAASSERMAVAVFSSGAPESIFPRTALTERFGKPVIVPAAPLLLQLGLPGPLQVFAGQPDARVVFSFPMSIAPMIGVPLFVLANLLVAGQGAHAAGRAG